MTAVLRGTFAFAVACAAGLMVSMALSLGLQIYLDIVAWLADALAFIPMIWVGVYLNDRLTTALKRWEGVPDDGT